MKDSPLPEGPHHRLVGPDRSAVRRPDRRSWLLVPREQLRQTRLPLGLVVELGRKDAPRDHSLTTEPSVGSRRLPVPLPPVGAGVGAILAAILAILAAVGFVRGLGAEELIFATSIETVGDLLVSLVVLWGTLSALLMVEGALLADSVQGTTHLVWMRRGLPEVEPVCWRLGIPASVAVLCLLLPATAFACALGWYSAFPALASGAAVGATIYTIQALYPLRPGPGARILEVLTRLEDIPTQLRWALVERFLPLPTRLDVGGTKTMAVAAVALAAWAAGTGQVIHGLSSAPPGGLTLAGSMWRVAAVLGLVAWAVWLVYRVGELFVAAARIRAASTLEPLTPSPELKRSWAEENPLNRHVPQLRAAPWSWGVAQRGSRLIEHGARDRNFYWLAKGQVHVVGRNAGGDPLHLATVPGGMGIGEIGLLEEAERTADVVAAEDSVVAILKHEDFVATVEEGGAERFREVVLASQALARARTFLGLSPDMRSRWLTHGQPARYDADEIVIDEGDERQWIGLVVTGQLAVERGDRRLATLGKDDVFGEMAYLTGRSRSARIRAEEPTLVWQWEPAWLDRELRETGVADELRELAEERARVPE